MTQNDMSKTLSDKVAVHLNLPFELETDLQLHSITAQMMVQIVDMTDNAIMQEIINYAKENKICDVYLLDKKFVKEALEKQIPKKPILDTIFPSGVKWYLCPACNHGNIIEKSGYFCHKCGQAFDWGDTK